MTTWNTPISIAKLFFLTATGIPKIGKKNHDEFLLSQFRPIIKTLLKPYWPITDKKVYTHRIVDVDAICCTALTDNYELITNIDEVTDSNSIVLDMKHINPSGKGEKSAFSLIAPGPKWLIDEIDCADTMQEVIPHFTLGEWCQYNKNLYQFVKGGIAKIQHRRASYKDKLSEVKLHQCGKYLFMEGGKGPDFCMWVQESIPNVVGGVYHNGYNLGIYRYPRNKTPCLKGLMRHLSNAWYFDERMFGVFHGTNTVPANRPPSNTEPNSCESLVRYVEEYCL